jgi:ATP synthase F1 gamma subunit
VRRPQEIDKDRIAMSSIVQLTGAFEGIASAHIARIKTQVQQSESFFKELWATYTSLRVGKEFHSGHTEKGVEIKKELIIIITAEGSLSGDIDQRLIEKMLEVYKKDTHDLIVVGHHGSVLLDQRKISSVQAHRLPEQGNEASVVEPIVQAVQRYTSATVYYQAYLSLMNQDIKSITLSAAIQERGENLEQTGELDDLITDVNFIFEPSIPAVVDYMERSMLGVALSEVILESKLAQQASRFRAMSAARSRAKESEGELVMQYNHAGRAIKDERTKEIVGSVLRSKTKKRRLVI